MTRGDRDLTGFVRRRAWLGTPCAEVDVDATTGLAAVTFCPVPPDVEHELDGPLSVGAHRSAGEFLLTSLVLARSPGAGGVPGLGPLLLGPTVTAVVAALSGAGGHAELLLDRQETGALMADWNRVLPGLFA